MSKWYLLPVTLVACSCGQGDHQRAAPSTLQPPLIAAAQSASLEFPLQFDAEADPPGYIKVGSATGQEESPERLISALVLCSPDLAWIEKTSHTMAVIMPSEENAVWIKSGGDRPSDRDIIGCVKESAKQPFFYRKLKSGIETYRQN